MVARPIVYYPKCSGNVSNPLLDLLNIKSSLMDNISDILLYLHLKH